MSGYFDRDSINRARIAKKMGLPSAVKNPPDVPEARKRAVRRSLEEIRAEIARQAPSVSRSDDMSALLEHQGLGKLRVLEKYDQLLDAQRDSTTWEKRNGKWEKLKIRVPDNRTQMRVCQELSLIHGWYFQPERSPATDPLSILMSLLPVEVREEIVEVILKRFPHLREQVAAEVQVVG